MVVSQEVRFRVSRYATDVPLSLGAPAPSQTSIYLPGAPLPWQSGWQASRPGLTIGVPGTGASGDYGYPIVDPNPGSCINGFTKNWLGQCVPINTLPACPTGYARDAQGNCVLIPVTPVPPTPGMSAQIVKIQLPRVFSQGRTVTIRTWFQNYRADNPFYAIKIDLPGITFTHTTPPIVTTAVGQTMRIDSTFVVPNFAQVAIFPPPPIPGTVSLLRFQQVQCVTTPCNPQQVEIPDTENISLYTQGVAPAPVPLCPTGYTGTYPNCIPPVTPPPTPCVKNPAICSSVYHGGCNTECQNPSSAACVSCQCACHGSTVIGGGPAIISVTPTTVQRRKTFIINGSGFRSREEVKIEIRILNRVSKTDQDANSSGQIRKSVRAPDTVGVATVTARGRKSGSVAITNITVT